MTKEEAIKRLQFVRNALDPLSNIAKAYDMAIEALRTKPISYRDCSNSMLKMWMDNVVTDGEYNRIMDKLNKQEMDRRKKEADHGKRQGMEEG